MIDRRAQAVADRLLGIRATVARLVAGDSTVAVERDVLVGRSEVADLVVALDVVSRQHCRVTAHGDGYRVSDLGSANGTVIVRGDETLPVGGEPVVLLDGDRLATSRGRFSLARFEGPSRT